MNLETKNEQEKLDSMEYVKFDSIFIELRRRQRKSVILKIRIALHLGKKERVNVMGIRDIMGCYKALFVVLELLQGVFNLL